jgi:hypothetical protein
MNAKVFDGMEHLYNYLCLFMLWVIAWPKTNSIESYCSCNLVCIVFLLLFHESVSQLPCSLLGAVCIKNRRRSAFPTLESARICCVVFVVSYISISNLFRVIRSSFPACFRKLINK